MRFRILDKRVEAVTALAKVTVTIILAIRLATISATSFCSFIFTRKITRLRSKIERLDLKLYFKAAAER